VAAESDDKIANFENELEIERDKGKVQDRWYQRLLKSESEDKKTHERQKEALERQIDEGIDKLAAKEIEENKRIISILRDENQRLKEDSSSKQQRIISLIGKLAEKDEKLVFQLQQEKQTAEDTASKQEKKEELETEIKKLREEIICLKKQEKLTETLMEVKDTETQTDKAETPQQSQPTTTTSQLSLRSAGSALLNPNSDADFSREEEKLNSDLLAKLKEAGNIAKQAIANEKEIMELRRRLFRIDQEKRDKRIKEGIEEVSLILQYLKNNNYSI